jgi:hypothetical protein
VIFRAAVAISEAPARSPDVALGLKTTCAQPFAKQRLSTETLERRTTLGAQRDQDLHDRAQYPPPRSSELPEFPWSDPRTPVIGAGTSVVGAAPFDRRKRADEPLTEDLPLDG